MPKAFPKLKDGDALQPWHLNVIYRELERLRKMTAAHPLAIDQADEDSVPPTFWFLGGDQLVPVQLGASGIAAGSVASPSSATVTLLDFADGGEGHTSTGAHAATMYSMFGTAIGANKFAWAAWRGERLYLVVGDC